MTLIRSDLIDIREAIDSDRNFILATWLRGLRYGNSWFEDIDSASYFSYYHNVIEIVLNNPATTVKIACLKEDPDVLIAYSVYSHDRLDWVFCKKNWRNIGVAKSLVPENITTVTHLTDTARSILKTRKGIKFNPFALS